MPEVENENLGALVDLRPAEEQERDPSIAEAVAAAAPVEWKEMKPSEVRQFGVQNQRGKSDCVAETRRKLRRIMFKVNLGLDVDFSAVYLYRGRGNYPDGGMAAMDAIALDSGRGMTLDPLLPSESYETEDKANAVVIEPWMDEVAKIFKVEKDLIFKQGDFETPASTIQKTKKGVMLWFYFTRDEWSREVPEVLVPNLSLTGPKTLRHSVTGVWPALYKGKKGYWIEDSAHFGGLNRRFITEAFFAARCWWASYPINLKLGAAQPVTDPERPRHTFGKRLVFIPLDPTTKDISDKVLNAAQLDDVAALQNILKFEGLFPVNIESTGYYGAITAEAVDKFQRKYAVAPTGELDELKGEAVGDDTRRKLNELYGA